MSAPSPPTARPPRPSRRRKTGVVVWLWVLGVCLSVLVATYLIFVEPPPPGRIVIATGNRDGAYFRYASQYAELLREDGLTVEVRATAGSVENLKLLGEEGSGVSVALVQSGLATPEDLRGVHALGSLYREPLWVFYRGEAIERLSQLAGKRVGIGPPGSGTHGVATRLLAANGLTGPGSAGGGARAELVEEDVAAAADSLRAGGLDAAFFAAAFEAEYIQSLFADAGVRLLGFDQQEAYHRRFRFLSPVTLPAGLIDLGRNVPGRDVPLLAPTAMLVARDDLHPAFVPLLLAAAARVHARGDFFSDPGEFPSVAYCDIPVGDDARHFYRFGPPVLQRLLPFWLASLVDRAKVMLIPLVMLMMPLLRATPPLMRWRTRRKIYLWYSDLREIDQNLVADLSVADLEEERGRLNQIEQQVAQVDVPLSYMEEVYHLRMHLALLKQQLNESLSVSLSRAEPGGPDPQP